MTLAVVWTESCESVARNAARGLFAPGMDTDDLLQEARIAVCDTLARFRPERGGTEFEGFAYFCARRRVISAVTAARRKKHAVLNGSSSFDSVVRFASGSEAPVEDVLASARPGPLDRLLAREAGLALSQAWARLSDLERVAISRCAIGGEPYADVGAPKTIDNALQRARAKLAVAA